jgi:hypothetical protein
VAGRDITDGRSTRAIAVDLGIGTGTIWQNTGIAYDCAIAGIPFFLGIKDDRPYERATAPFRKEQFDSQTNPGEQSLTGWWLRSQNSFHTGEGFKYYDPLSNPYATTISTNSYRYYKSLGVEVMDEVGEVSLLRKPVLTQATTTGLGIETVTVAGADRILLHDGNTLKITDGTTSAMTTISAGVNTSIYAFANDGLNAYYIDAAHIVKVALTGGSTSSVRNVSGTVTSAAMGYVKQRLVVGINNVLYEMTTTTGGGSLPTPIYTHPNASWRWTSITEGGNAIYAAGFAGANSAIYKFTLATDGTMPVLTYGVIAVLMPDGEVIHNIHVHLMSYMAIGTNLGVRVGDIDNTTGNITYGPIIIKTERPVRGFDAHDSYIYCSSSFTDEATGLNRPGIYRINLASEIETLRFAYQTDIYPESISSGEAVDVCWLGRSKQLAFLCGTVTNAVTTVGNLGLFVQSATEVYSSGYIQTGYIRFNTLEHKNFKRLTGLGDFTHGSLSLQTVDVDGTRYDVNSYDAAIGNPESTITQPFGPQDSIALRFTLFRDDTDVTTGPIFKGYQLKALPGNPRNRIIKVPLMNFDIETDKYNTTVGYEGRAFDRLATLETAESVGDIVSWQDFRTGETQQVLIEQVLFNSSTPPDKKLTGFGGIISLTIRTV